MFLTRSTTCRGTVRTPCRQVVLTPESPAVLVTQKSIDIQGMLIYRGWQVDIIGDRRSDVSVLAGLS